jgi:hypothetical protein
MIEHAANLDLSEKHAAQHRGAPMDGQGKNILAVEDYASNRTLLACLLEQA